MARDRDQTDAVRPADRDTAWPCGAAAPRARTCGASHGEHFAYPRARGRGRGGRALTARSQPLDARLVRTWLRPLPPDAGKEARGRVLIVGGSHRYPGAVLLAARAAARCGAGVVTVAAARSLVEMIAGQDPNITFFPLAEAQPGVVATGAPAQVTPIFGAKIRPMLIRPGLG